MANTLVVEWDFLAPFVDSENKSSKAICISSDDLPFDPNLLSTLVEYLRKCHG